MGMSKVAQIFFAVVSVSFVVQGWVPVTMLQFPVLSSIYIFILSRYVVPPVTSRVEPGLFEGSKSLKRYVLFAALIGLLLPLVYIVAAYLQGDLAAARAAAPSLFLLILQVFSENYTYRRVEFSVLIRPLVAMLYNTRRLFTIWDELLFLFGNRLHASNEGLLLFGRVLTLMNALFWNWNLFGFLIPVFLVRSMRQYYDLEKKVKQ